MLLGEMGNVIEMIGFDFVSVLLQHYRCASSSSQSTYHSPISALSPSSMFTNSIAIESSPKPAPTEQMDVSESMTSKNEFTAVSHAQSHTESGLDNDMDLLFQQLPLPEQLLQSDDKDGEDDSSSNSLNNRNNIDLHEPAADNQQQQDQIKVICHCHTDHRNCGFIFMRFGCHSQEEELKPSLSAENNGMLPSFNNLTVENETAFSENGKYKFREWHELVHINDLAILPYVVID